MRESDEIAERLELMWRWLSRNPDSPRYSEREIAFLVGLKRYEDAVDDERKERAA